MYEQNEGFPAMAIPAADFQVLTRLGFGPDMQSAQSLASLGMRGWVNEQLHPQDNTDEDCNRRLATCRVRIRYPESKDWSAVDETRPLQWLDAPIDRLWALNDPGKQIPNPEKARPRIEVTMVTLLRAVYSRWQLREVLCDFWHNHFNVNAWDTVVGLTLPVYDREVIRRHCLGNFREMVEAVAKSSSMLWYLNNRTSRSGAPNENYARELFELHTLGRDAYLNGLYNRWRDVPGASTGRPEGYIDQDVYESARAFTGWGVEDGSGLGGPQVLPRTGRYTYVEAWHDNYQKRVLATEFDPYQAPQADGKKVLDLAAFHPATARHLAKKLCMRLVSDNPPDSLIASAAKVWIDNRDRSDQIAQTVAHIVFSPEFMRSRNQKVKRPLELLASFVRATGSDFNPTEPLIYEMDGAGQRLFGWGPPTGHPDTSADWLGANAIRRRWSLVAGLSENWWATGVFDPFAQLATRELEATRFATFWVERLHGSAEPRLIQGLLDAAGLKAGQVLNNAGTARRMVAWVAMSPTFQQR